MGKDVKCPTSTGEDGKDRRLAVREEEPAVEGKNRAVKMPARLTRSNYIRGHVALAFLFSPLVWSKKSNDVKDCESTSGWRRSASEGLLDGS